MLDGASNFLTFSLHTATALPETGSESALNLADVDRDGTLDLVQVKTAGTASGHVETTVLSGVGGFQTFLSSGHDTGRGAADRGRVALPLGRSQRRQHAGPVRRAQVQHASRARWK